MRLGNAADLLSDPAYLLDRIDLAERRLIFLPTRRSAIEAASFLDGRNPIATGDAVGCALDSALSVAPDFAPLPDRFIFHLSFCGSTLLARLLDRPGRTMVLREPSILVSLSDWKARLQASGESDPALDRMVALACASLRAPWQAGEEVIVKPSNWVNNLLPQLCSADRESRSIFVTSTRRAFITAVFRGGRDRMVFTMRAAAHLANGKPGDQALLSAASRASADPIGQVAHIALFAHWLQLRLFREALARKGWGSDHLVGLDMIDHDPFSAASAAASVLGLSLSAEDLAAGIARHSGYDAKQPGATYSVEAHEQADRQIELHHRNSIEAALGWADDVLPWIDMDDEAGGQRDDLRRAG